MQPAGERTRDGGTAALARRPRTIAGVISRVHSFVLQGVDAVPCEVEADVGYAETRKTTIVGLPDAAVKESIDRVRTAILNSGYVVPGGWLTINLAPAHLRKEGPVYDLPIAVAVLTAGRTIVPPADGQELEAESFLIAGELALDGRVRPVRGIVSLALLARELGKRGVIVAASSAAEAAVVEGIEVLGINTLAEVVGLLNGRLTVEPHAAVDLESLIAETKPSVDFGDVRGQEAVKRAITIAAAGAHNLLMIGPAGTGKTMMAKALPGVLPPLSADEALEVTRIYSSVGGLGPREPLKTARPVRAPHHTASAPAIVGGGSVPRPGDVSLAHRGVLFLDEMPEFPRNVLETLRQPLEDGYVTIARRHGTVRFPARFMMVAALNPTPKGNMARDEISQRAMERYLARISGPLIDRIDIHVEVPAVPFRQLSSRQRGTDTEAMRRRVLEARAIQQRRQGPALANAELTGGQLDRHAALDEAAQMVLGQAMTEMGLSARAYDKIRRVARTIADLEGNGRITSEHVCEAVQYRLLDRIP
jgi:magnesium chelatase family protein